MSNFLFNLYICNDIIRDNKKIKRWFFVMMDKKDSTERTQIEIFSLEDLVPTNHLVRKFENAIDLSLFMTK